MRIFGISGGRALWCCEEGATALEISLLLPVFFLLLFGFFSFSIVIFGYCNASYACIAAARNASLHSGTSLAPATTSSIQGFVTPYLWAAPTSGTTITTTWTPTNAVGNTVKVAVSIVYPVRIPLFALKSLTVGSSAQRVILE